MNVKPIPDGYDCLVPYLIVRDAARALDFYKDLFGATELLRMPDPTGACIMHAELKIRNAVLMLADEFPDHGHVSPQTSNGPQSCSLLLYLPDVDAVYARALSMGATSQQPPANQFYGDRTARFVDPFGHTWAIATHVEDVPPEEMQQRAAQLMKQPGS